jgi:dihydroorotase
LHIAHISTREGVEHVRRAKEAGLKVTAEVTPHHLVMSDRMIMECSHGCTHRHERADYKMAPPLRSPEHQEALLNALNEGVIDMVASDHAPHGCVDKETEFELAANGILGLQTTVPILLGLVHQKKLKLERMIESLSTAPGKLFSHQVTIQVGAIADLTLLDLDREWVLTADQLASKSSNSPFSARAFRGASYATIIAGDVKWVLGGVL